MASVILKPRSAASSSSPAPSRSNPSPSPISATPWMPLLLTSFQLPLPGRASSSLSGSIGCPLLACLVSGCILWVTCMHNRRHLNPPVGSRVHQATPSHWPRVLSFSSLAPALLVIPQFCHLHHVCQSQDLLETPSPSPDLFKCPVHHSPCAVP